MLREVMRSFAANLEASLLPRDRSVGPLAGNGDSPYKYIGLEPEWRAGPPSELFPFTVVAPCTVFLRLPASYPLGNRDPGCAAAFSQGGLEIPINKPRGRGHKCGFGTGAGGACVLAGIRCAPHFLASLLANVHLEHTRGQDE